ncbi:hypothetical protein Tco_0921615 [Tanacetum coccineum]
MKENSSGPGAITTSTIPKQLLDFLKSHQFFKIILFRAIKGVRMRKVRKQNLGVLSLEFVFVKLKECIFDQARIDAISVSEGEERSPRLLSSHGGNSSRATAFYCFLSMSYVVYPMPNLAMRAQLHVPERLTGCGRKAKVVARAFTPHAHFVPNSHCTARTKAPSC